jgi:hypothetical protein
MEHESQFQKDLRAAYPKRSGGQNWIGAWRQIGYRLRQGFTREQMLEGAKRYAEYVRSVKSEGTVYVKQAATFFGPDLHFLEGWVSENRVPRKATMEDFK